MLAEARTEENRTAAEKEFLAELSVNPRDSGSLYQLGQIALERKDFPRAKSLLLQALAARPEYADAHVALSKVYEYEGDVKSAITELEAAEKLAPGIKTTHYRLAQLYRQAGRASDSNREMESFRNLSRPEQPALGGEPPKANNNVGASADTPATRGSGWCKLSKDDDQPSSIKISIRKLAVKLSFLIDRSAV